jgi:hypothetical protein
MGMVFPPTLTVGKSLGESAETEDIGSMTNAPTSTTMCFIVCPCLAVGLVRRTLSRYPNGSDNVLLRETLSGSRQLAKHIGVLPYFVYYYYRMTRDR